MTFKKIEAGIYKSENGYTIKKVVSTNIFTGKPMSDSIWYIYNSDNKSVAVALTLKEAKELVEMF